MFPSLITTAVHSPSAQTILRLFPANEVEIKAGSPEYLSGGEAILVLQYGLFFERRGIGDGFFTATLHV